MGYRLEDIGIQIVCIVTLYISYILNMYSLIVISDLTGIMMKYLNIYEGCILNNI